MNISSIVHRADLKHPAVQWGALLGLMLLAMAVFWLVHATGGIKYVYSHSMYVVIIAAAMIFGVKGGIAFGCLGGLLLGPFTPIDTFTGEQQLTINWLYRLGFFILIGLIVGASSDFIKEYIRQIQWRLSHNLQSGIPNRHALVDTLINGGMRPGEGRDTIRIYLIYLLDLHEFEMRLGSKLRESVILQLANRMQREFPGPMGLFHPRSNHLALVVRNGMNLGEPEFKRWLGETMNQPCVFEDVPIILDYCCGVIDVSRDDDAMESLRKVEICVSHAASRRLGLLHYSPGLDQISKENIELLGRFKRALDDGHLAIEYQPKYDLKTRQIHGAEALLRWHDPVKGTISPGRFIPVVEGSQLIHSLSRWVLERVLRDIKQCENAGIRLHKMAVNISGLNLLNQGFIGDVSRLLDKYQVLPAMLELEVTESALLSDFDVCARQLHQLVDMGVAVSLDDFGTGYCSLQYLDQLPFSVIKLDKVFLRNLKQERGRCAIVRNTIILAHELGAELVAEGIEDASTEGMLMEMGCDRGQGYFFARPMPLHRLQAFFKSQLLETDPQGLPAGAALKPS